MRVPFREIHIFFVCIVVGILAPACHRGIDNGFLGSAVMQAHTYQIAAAGSGIVMHVAAQEGARVEAGNLLAVVDTVPLVLKIVEMDAAIAELDAMTASKIAERGSMEADVRGLARDYGRVGELADMGSIATQKKDDLGTKVQVGNQKITAFRHQHVSLMERKKMLLAGRALLMDQLTKCYIRAPADGVIVNRYKNTGEVVTAGAAILELAAVDTLYADFFVPQPLFAALKSGDSVRIRVDTGTQKKLTVAWLPACIVWLSDEAEFTPKNIQTRESRTELVFRVRAQAVDTHGLLKRGLPVEIWQ